MASRNCDPGDHITIRPNTYHWQFKSGNQTNLNGKTFESFNELERSQSKCRVFVASEWIIAKEIEAGDANRHRQGAIQQDKTRQMDWERSNLHLPSLPRRDMMQTAF
ncbi:MAG: hypothetical protein CMJ19_03210 [Phycisphaeraceae bacterium]|nr:hypothetical protein [Phycisphaeraceae bacterium]